MKLICFSLWGDLPQYTIGAIENAKLQKFIYPGWICRFYVDDSVPAKTIAELDAQGSEIIHIDNSFYGFQKLLWRLFPAQERHVEYFIVRDCDSRLNIREALAVKQWIESGLPFHIMRDNQCHILPIIGGMWGGKGGILTDIIEASYEFIKQNTHTGLNELHTIEQEFLKLKIWPLIRDIHCGHGTMNQFTGKELPFPIELEAGMFVGQSFDEYTMPVSRNSINTSLQQTESFEQDRELLASHEHADAN